MAGWTAINAPSVNPQVDTSQVIQTPPVSSQKALILEGYPPKTVHLRPEFFERSLGSSQYDLMKQWGFPPPTAQLPPQSYECSLRPSRYDRVKQWVPSLEDIGRHTSIPADKLYGRGKPEMSKEQKAVARKERKERISLRKIAKKDKKLARKAENSQPREPTKKLKMKAPRAPRTERKSHHERKLAWKAREANKVEVVNEGMMESKQLSAEGRDEPMERLR